MMLLAAIFLALGAPLHAQGIWRSAATPRGLVEIYLDQKASILGVAANSKLDFSCSRDVQGATGFLSMKFAVAPVSRMKGFHFDLFEGPDAPAGEKRLLEIAVIKQGRRKSFYVEPNGWFSGETPDAFVFGAGTPTKDSNGYMRQILELLVSADKVDIHVTDAAGSREAISASFPVAQDRDKFKVPFGCAGP